MATKKPNSNLTKAKQAKAPAKKPRTAKATATRVTKAKLKAKRIAEEFVASGGNKARAARAAGSKAKNATQAANEVLKKPEVQAEIDRLLVEARTAKVMEATEVLERLTEQARFDLTAYQNKDGSLKLEQIKEDGKGHCLMGFRTQYNRKTKILRTEGMAINQQKALFKLADIYGLPQQPRSNEFETVRRAVAEFMTRNQCTISKAIEFLRDDFPVVRKYEQQLRAAF